VTIAGKINTLIATMALVAGVLLVLYLAVLGLQSAHVHAEHVLVTDCVYCQSDPGHGGASDTLQVASRFIPAVEPLISFTPAIIAVLYRLPVRGPPAITS
jgi:hypothetical protein